MGENYTDGTYWYHVVFNYDEKRYELTQTHRQTGVSAQFGSDSWKSEVAAYSALRRVAFLNHWEPYARLLDEYMNG